MPTPSNSSTTTTPQAASGAARLLQRQLKEMGKAKDLPGISVGLINDDNVFEWEVVLMINDDCKYYGGNTCLARSLHRLSLATYIIDLLT